MSRCLLLVRVPPPLAALLLAALHLPPRCLPTPGAPSRLTQARRRVSAVALCSQRVALRLSFRLFLEVQLGLQAIVSFVQTAFGDIIDLGAPFLASIGLSATRLDVEEALLLYSSVFEPQNELLVSSVFRVTHSQSFPCSGRW